MHAHLESWLLRLALLATAVYQIVTRNQEGATVAIQGLVVSLLPLLVGRLSRAHVPRPLEFAFVLGMALQYISESTKLFEHFYYWDKLVHPTLIALTGMIGTWLLLGYRDAFAKRIPVHLAAAFGMLLGISIGALWEFIEFSTDWFSNADLQKSNGDTLTDIMSNGIGAFVATLLGLWLFTHHFTPKQRNELGRVAWWLADGPTRLMRAHGRIVGTVLTLALAAVLFLSQWVDRDIPALASGVSAGADRAWQFTQDGAASDAQVLSGDWVSDPRGICHENLDNPKPGSEKMGVLELTPGVNFGADEQSFSVRARYFEERPQIAQGSEMDAGVAFGIRDASNFNLVDQNALHDVLRLSQFIHNNRRVLREKLFRTHGNEWHTLQMSVSGSSVTAGVDGETIYTVDGVRNADGPIGLWARGASATCFSDVSVTAST